MGMEKANALEKYPPHCDEEESNGNGCVPLFSTFLYLFDFFFKFFLFQLKALKTVYEFILHCRKVN